MRLSKVIKEAKIEIRPREEDIAVVSAEAKKFKQALEESARKNKIVAEVSLGGSFAKGTLLKNKTYEVDVLLRFDKVHKDEISKLAEKLAVEMSQKMSVKLERIHGSRDYFRFHMKDSNVLFELIPVLLIRSAREAENVTDLSYFHVSYVRKKCSGLEDEIRLAKSFCRANGIYGAESYIQGFSGYALECLIMQYKSFARMLKSLSKTKERIFLDPGRLYKNKVEIGIQLNESKLKSPIVVIDPTNKERNALASLSGEMFGRFQDAAKAFLKKPSKEYFVEKKLDVDELKRRAKKNKASFMHIRILTARQAGDIAGTKMKKFHYVLERDMRKEFDVVEHHFVYNGDDSASIYLITKPKKDLLKIGPPLEMKSHVKAFRKENKTVFVKQGRLYAHLKSGDVKKYISDYAKKELVQQMDISGIEIL